MSEIISAKSDVVFKILFSQDKELLMGFLNDVLDLQIESPDDIQVLNPELPPDFTAGKFSRLDINLKSAEQNINIEMQIASETDFRERILFYWSKMYAGDLQQGEPYATLLRSISVSILNFNMFDCPSYHSEFCILEKDRHELLTDKFAMHFFELKKVQKIDKQTDAADRRQLWMQFINADSEEDFAMLKTTDNALIQKGVRKIYELSEDDKLRELVRQREKAARDYDSAMANARNAGMSEAISKMTAALKAAGISDDDIQKAIAAAGLS